MPAYGYGYGYGPGWGWHGGFGFFGFLFGLFFLFLLFGLLRAAFGSRSRLGRPRRRLGLPRRPGRLGRPGEHNGDRPWERQARELHDSGTATTRRGRRGPAIAIDRRPGA